jgi:hypothetical protein
LSEDEKQNRIYAINDLIDDLRQPRSQDEAIATGAHLYEMLGDFYLRAQDKWSASGKTLPLVIRKTSVEMGTALSEAFAHLFCNGEPKGVIEITESILEPYGGLVFDGYSRTAPKDWRKELGEL